MPEVKEDDLTQAVAWLTSRQDHPNLSPGQMFQLKCMVNKVNSVSQTPTGSGKTYAGICLPDILNILRNKLGYEELSEHHRVLYIVPLVSIMESLEEQLINLDISYQFLRAGTTNIINDKIKVVAISPEKLVEKETLAAVTNLKWAAIILDEPHLAVQWGIGNKKKGKIKKPFREAFSKLNRLNETGAVFQLQTATAVDLEKVFALLGKKDSSWVKNIKLPERRNLVYYIFSGKHAPSNIFQFACVSEFLEIESDNPGALLIYVQRVEDGSDIYFEINEFCTEKNIPKIPHKRFAFLHANLEDERKREILKNTIEGKVKILIATSAVGNGVNLPIFQTILWGLDPEPSGVIQASGRTARHPNNSEGVVIMVGNLLVYGMHLNQGVGVYHGAGTQYYFSSDPFPKFNSNPHPD